MEELVGSAGLKNPNAVGNSQGESLPAKGQPDKSGGFNPLCHQNAVALVSNSFGLARNHIFVTDLV